MRGLNNRFKKMNQRMLKITHGVDYTKSMSYKLTIDDHLVSIFEAHIHTNIAISYENSLAIELSKHFDDYPLRFKGE